MQRLPLQAVLAACAVMLVLLLAGTALAVWDMRRAARVAAEDTLTNVALSLERVLVHDLLAYDFALRSIAERRAQPPTQFVRTDVFGAVLTVDAQGRAIDTTRGELPPDDLSARPDFIAHRDKPGLGLILGAIEPGSVTGRPKIWLSRRRETADGAFAGIVTGNVKLEYFLQAFLDFRVEPSGMLALVAMDGRMIVSLPGKLVAPGTDVNRAPAMARLRSDGPGLFSAISVVDGQERMFNIQRLNGLPIWLVVAMPSAGIYADWTWRALLAAAEAAGFLSLLAIAGLLLRRELRQRRLAEDAALASAEQARTAAADVDLVSANTDDLILKLDWDGTRRFVSAASERLLGYSPQELLAGNSFAFVHPDDMPAIRASMSALRSGSTDMTHVAYRLHHRDGSVRHVEARCRALPDRSGLIVAVRDETDRLMLEDRLRHAQRMEAVGQLTAGVAHDFNNMLQGQIAGLELLIDEVAGQGRATALAEQAIAAGEKGAKLTHSLLAFSRQQVLRPEPVDVPRLLAGLQQLLSRTLEPKVALAIEVEEGLPACFADPGQLEAALLNLCLNARDAMRERGGQLLIEAYGGAVSPGVAEGPDNRHAVVLAVSDEGCGIPAEALAKVCEPFFTTKPVGEGSGLGLSMVQGFARQSGGELRLQSWPGAGTRVQLWLPCAATPAAVPEACAPSPAGAGRVLLVDDDPMIRSTLGAVLRNAGFDVTDAPDGHEAAALLKQDPDGFDVLVTDQGMPGMSGAELIARAHRLRPGLPAMIVTGYTDHRLLDAVPDSVTVLYKPFRSPELVRRLMQLLEDAAVPA